MSNLEKGLPSVWLLLYTILLWVFFAAILLSNKKNKMNRWGFIGGIFFSGGVFKEYLYFGVAPAAIRHFPAITERFCTGVYSVVTAMLYYLAMPSIVMMCFHFSGVPRRHPHFFRVARYAVFLPALLFGLVVPYHRTRYYQLYVPSYYQAVSCYNWLYGLLITWLLLSTLYRRRLSYDYQQKLLVTVNTLLPMWYWLTTAFLIHVLRLTKFFKAWQGNIVIIVFLLAYFVYHLFHNGIWGSRLYRVTSDQEAMQSHVRSNTQYVTHALKNEVTKIKWCVTSLLPNASDAQISQLNIILRSSEHLEKFIERTRLLAQDISLSPTAFPVCPVLKQCIADSQATAPASVEYELSCGENDTIYTDREHFIEMIHNLLNNAIDVLPEAGKIHISYRIDPGRRCAILAVSDNGHGMTREALGRLFQPYYTTKGTTMEHLGLGLYYCYHVMEKQNGGIRVKSIPSQGSTFFLYFPYKKKKYEK